jgi:hypothetical protein
MGKPLKITSELEIFKNLGLDYVKPEDRNFAVEL